MLRVRSHKGTAYGTNKAAQPTQPYSAHVDPSYGTDIDASICSVDRWTILLALRLKMKRRLSATFGQQS